LPHGNSVCPEPDRVNRRTIQPWIPSE
jgi:hypothetical protein